MMPYDYPIDQLANELLAGVRKLVESEIIPVRRGEFTLWTDAIKMWLANKARERDLIPIYCDREGTREFMLDMVWWQPGSGARAILACESELGNTRYPARNPGLVAEDFDKLLSFKAPLKLIIFDSYCKIDDNDQPQRAIIAELDKYLKEYGDHRVGEQYLAIDVSPTGAAWACVITSPGQNHDLHFERLPR
jgi:hypothetical protein